jgi:acyl phosphate:glycerol-3-phosphate acyltransferase
VTLVLALVAAYALGSIPAAYLAGMWKGIDLRKHGSGNLGATNVFRVLGPRIGTAVFVFDMLKGAVPVLFFWRFVDPATIESPVIIQILCGVAAIAGHVRPLWLRFGKGGKGVATAGGVFLALAPVETGLALAAFAVTLLASGYVSLGSMIAAVLLPALLFIREGASPLFIVCALIAVFVFWTHRPNIERLRQGTENRFGKKEGKRTPVVLIALGVAGVVALYAAMRVS